MNRDADFVMVRLNVPPQIEETVVDWLLGRSGDAGFTSYRVFGHSSSHSGLSAAEQVSGRRHRVRYEIEMPRAEAGDFIQAASTEFAGADVRCVVIPVISSGSLARAAQDFRP